MPSDRMTPEQLLDGYAPIRIATAEHLRGLVKATLPDAVERVRTGWRLIGYDVPISGRLRYVAFVWPEPEHVHLGFEHGTFMDDPHGALGGGFLKKVRFVTLTRPGDVPDAVIADLLREAVRVAAWTRAERTAVLLDREDRVRP